MKNLTTIALGVALIALSSSSSSKSVSAQSQAVTCSSSAIPVTGSGGNYVYEFTNTNDFVQLKICSTSRVYGTNILEPRRFVGNSNWTGSFVIFFDENFDDEVEIQSTMQHIPNINYTTTSVRNRRSHWLHAEGDSGTTEGYGKVLHSPCNFPNCFEDVFTERLTWSSHSEGWFDRDEIDSWTYILEARHRQVPLIE